MQKLLAKNKYKLMALIIGLYLLADVLQHKGQARVLFSKDFPEVIAKALLPQSKSVLINKDKSWKKGVNTKERMNELNVTDAGFECDVYFDTAGGTFFHVYHDPDINTDYTLDDLLKLYQQKKMNASIWLDIKNLDDFTAGAALQSLIDLQKKYKLQNKILIESGRADLLTAFSDSGFFTSYYIPFFNPYQLSKIEIKLMADSVASIISKSKINALSGYYFQSSFLSHYFPEYPVLTWVDNSSYSLVNFLFQRKINADKAIFISLKP